MDISKAAAALGRKGGLAGRGESQRRGDSDHYRAMVARRWNRGKLIEDPFCYICAYRVEGAYTESNVFFHENRWVEQIVDGDGRVVKTVTH